MICGILTATAGAGYDRRVRRSALSVWLAVGCGSGTIAGGGDGGRPAIDARTTAGAIDAAPGAPDAASAQPDAPAIRVPVACDVPPEGMPVDTSGGGHVVGGGSADTCTAEAL